MALIDTDPEKIRQFADRLDRFSREVEAALRKLSSGVQKYCASWDDRESREFDTALDRMLRDLGSFQGKAKEQVPRLREDAKRVEDYQDHKIVDR